MDLKNRIEKTFMTSLYSPLNFSYPTVSLFKIEKCCLQRLKLYKLLQKASVELYSEAWIAHVVKAMAKEGLENFLALLDEHKTSELGNNSFAEPNTYKPVSQYNSESSDKCVAALDAPPVLGSVELDCDGLKQLSLFDSLLEEYFVDDETGHFIFALMAATSNELKGLFIQLETQWCQLKFNLNVPEDSMFQFCKRYNIGVKEASKEEILSLKDLLSFYNLGFETDVPLNIFKLPFKEAPNLIVKREVVIKDGIMYFPNRRKHFSLLLQHIVRKNWEKKVQECSKFWIHPCTDERMEVFINNFIPLMKPPLHYSGDVGPGILTLQTIDDHSLNLFPLCMSELHHTLKEIHHLHHFARRQYALFLKHAGMSFEDAIQLFESEFTKKITKDDFRKKRYYYYFSHCYGKEGGATNYPVQSCDKIITETPVGNQEHGCPFAHADQKGLTKILEKQDITRSTIGKILDNTKDNQYKNACCLYFKEKMNRPLETLNSPNNYYVCALPDIEDLFT